MGEYDKQFRRSLDDPEGFWLEAAEAIDWTRAPTRALDSAGAPLYRWFPDGELNTSYNALDRHVEAGNGERTALIWDSPVTGNVATRSPLSPGRWRHWVSPRATGCSSTCRWCPKP